MTNLDDAVLEPSAKADQNSANISSKVPYKSKFAIQVVLAVSVVGHCSDLDDSNAASQLCNPLRKLLCVICRLGF